MADLADHDEEDVRTIAAADKFLERVEHGPEQFHLLRLQDLRLLQRQCALLSELSRLREEVVDILVRRPRSLLAASPLACGVAAVLSAAEWRVVQEFRMRGTGRQAADPSALLATDHSPVAVSSAAHSMQGAAPQVTVDLQRLMPQTRSVGVSAGTVPDSASTSTQTQRAVRFDAQVNTEILSRQILLKSKQAECSTQASATSASPPSCREAACGMVSSLAPSHDSRGESRQSGIAHGPGVSNGHLPEPALHRDSSCQTDPLVLFSPEMVDRSLGVFALDPSLSASFLPSLSADAAVSGMDRLSVSKRTDTSPLRNFQGYSLDGMPSPAFDPAHLSRSTSAGRRWRRSPARRRPIASPDFASALQGPLPEPHARQGLRPSEAPFVSGHAVDGQPWDLHGRGGGPSLARLSSHVPTGAPELDETMLELRVATLKRLQREQLFNEGVFRKRPLGEIRHMIGAHQSKSELDWAVGLCEERHRSFDPRDVARMHSTHSSSVGRKRHGSPRRVDAALACDSISSSSLSALYWTAHPTRRADFQRQAQTQTQTFHEDDGPGSRSPRHPTSVL